MILKFSLLVLLDILFAISLFEHQLILAAFIALTFIFYTIELAVEMDFEQVELALVYD
jgi:hypothetical protein